MKKRIPAEHATSLVSSYDEARHSIERFNQELQAGDADLAHRLGFNRAWYYADDVDLVGPSKFIGYAGMTARDYVRGGALDGRSTEPALRRWFRLLEAGTPEEAFVRAKVEALVSRHGKSLNRAVRFAARTGWKAPGKGSPRPETHVPARGYRTIHATITRGESLWVAECERLAVVTQGPTIDDAISNLKEAVELHLEGEDLEALGLSSHPTVLVTIELQPWAA